MERCLTRDGQGEVMADLAPAATPLTSTTRGVPPPSRQRLLHTLSEQGLLPLEPLPDSAPRVDLVKWRLPGLGLLSGSFAGVRQDGRPTSIGADDLFFGINLTGRSLARQRRQEITIGAGEAAAINPDGGAFTVLRPDPCQVIGLRIPRRTAPFETAGADRSPLRVVPGHTAALQLLTRYLRSVLDGPVPSSAPLADAIVTHLTELIELSLTGTDPAAPPTGERSVRAARLAAIKADINRHLTDCSLTVGALAAQHGITARYVHMLFEEEAMTFSQYVLERRLTLAYQRLRNPRWAARTVSSIASDAGFGDQSYFNRTFRRRYSITPSDARRGTPASCRVRR